MTTFYITHTDHDGERHQIYGAWQASTPEAAIAQMLETLGAEDDNCWEAHEATSEGDIINHA